MKKKNFKIVFYALFAALIIHVIISWVNICMDFSPQMSAEISHVKSANPLPFPNVVGIHKVNDRKKLERALKKHKNFEVDVLYTNDDFYVGRSKEKLGHLTLSGLLYGFDLSKSYIWLDLKDSEPASKSLSERLLEILEETGIGKEKVLVEGEPEFIKELSEAGFYTMFTPYISRHMTLEERNRAIRHTEALIRDTGASALEGDISTYNMTRIYFPQMCKAVIFARPWVEVRKRLIMRKLARDPKVKFFVYEKL